MPPREASSVGLRAFERDYRAELVRAGSHAVGRTPTGDTRRVHRVLETTFRHSRDPTPRGPGEVRVEGGAPMSAKPVVDRIISAARAELRARGVGELRIRSIAARAGVSPGTLTYYFPTVRDLLEALLNEFRSASWDVFTRSIDVERGTVDEALVGELFELCCTWREELRARMYLTSLSGTISPMNWRGSLAPLLENLERLGGPSMRLRGHTFVCVVIRYAIHSSAELRAITSRATDDEAKAVVLEHLRLVAGLPLASPHGDSPRLAGDPPLPGRLRNVDRRGAL